ncbi:MAG: hypothetical protein M1812_006703 [Candelaria pacifica]|nr:MAG: hypothetical protein M1812_006703 [Candelaria pacifica]
MAQGQLKKPSKSHSSSTKRPTILGPKKGARTIAPKKATLVAHKKITKKHSSGLIAKTERNLAEKAGHLEILKGGKKKNDVGGEGKVEGKGKRGKDGNAAK